MSTPYKCSSCGVSFKLSTEHGLRYTICPGCYGFGERLSPESTLDEGAAETCKDCGGAGFILEPAIWLLENPNG